MPPSSASRASITEVAHLAGVSVGTVSNVLNRPDIVASATRERVQHAIDELGFVRNPSARQLRTGITVTVGLIVLDIRNPFFTEIARGAEDRLAEADRTLMLASSDGDADREAMFLRLFEEAGVAGVLVAPRTSDLTQIRALQRRGTPVVLLDAFSTVADIPSVAVDDVAGGALAASHLFGLGYRHLVFLNGPATIRQCADRRRGATQAAQAVGLDPAQAITEVELASLDAAGGDAAMTTLIENDAIPHAVLCVNDLVAVGVQRALRRAGGSALLSQVAIVGYDDVEVAGELAVPLTSVRQPAYDVGHAAADLLVGHGEPSSHVVFTPELIVRESTTGPASGNAR